MAKAGGRRYDGIQSPKYLALKAENRLKNAKILKDFKFDGDRTIKPKKGTSMEYEATLYPEYGLRSNYNRSEVLSHKPHDIKVSADRKSTRLNSSHRCISYDVFCLKKKKKTKRKN